VEVKPLSYPIHFFLLGMVCHWYLKKKKNNKLQPPGRSIDQGDETTEATSKLNQRNRFVRG